MHHGASTYGGSRFANNDRDRVWSVRPTNPIMISQNLADIPMQLGKRFDLLDDDDIIFESELMKYKPGLRH